MLVHPDRTRGLNDCPVGQGPVVYWMQRDQRAQDNWALLYAQEKAKKRGVQLVVIFNCDTAFDHVSVRQFDFMWRGLEETAAELKKKHIPFVLLEGQPEVTIPQFVKKYAVGELVCDFNPLRFARHWRTRVAQNLSVRVTEVDAHNIVPCWVVSAKQEYAAYTFRPKIHRRLSEFLTDFPPLHSQATNGEVKPSKINWNKFAQNLQINQKVRPIQWLIPGTQTAKIRAQAFIAQQLDQYDELRNNPNKEGISHMSPYLHFGQLSAQWLAYAVNNATDISRAGRDGYLEELVVRRELSDNFCFYNPKYDKVVGASAWAQKTIAAHAGDAREHLYERQELEAARTHDELWNAMQIQMVNEGKMHGWCRMYWAKKILVWSANAQTAIDRALYLNDKYELDGNDPNGVVGVMWSICGVHDRAWGERLVFGKIRYMNVSGAKRKFDVAAYVATYSADDEVLHDD